MKRKVIKQGNGTLTITLPKGWTEKIGLKGGDEIDVQSDGDILKVGFSEGKQKKKEFSICLAKEEMADKRYLEAHLDSLYIAGYDRIILELPEKKSINAIQSIIKDNFLGYEISSFDKSKCVIDNIANPTDEKFDIILRRIFLMTKRLIEDFYSDISSNNFNNLEFHKGQSKSIKSYSNYCLRIIANNGNSRSSNYALWSIILRVTQIYNIMMYCYERMPGYKAKIYPDTNLFFQQFINLFDLSYSLFYGYNIEKTKKIHEGYYKAVYPNLYGKFLSKKGGESFLIYHIGKAIRQVLYVTQFTISFNDSQK